MLLQLMHLRLLPVAILGASVPLQASFIEEFKEIVLEPFVDPDDQSWGVTASFADSDDDAVYAIHRGWHTEFGDTDFEYGWEVGGGIAYSGKRDEAGVFVHLDLVAGRELFEFGPVELDFYLLAGVQFQSIEVPGGTYNNFRLGAYFDWEIEVQDQEWFIRTGYLHISNANVGGRNEGHDALWAGAGFRW